MASRSAPRRILVTGAGSGIGGAVADRLAAAGHAVIGTVRGADRATALTRDATGTRPGLTFRALDLTSPAQIEALARQILDEGGIDVLVNNAGFGLFGAVEDADADEVARQFEVNLLGPLHLTRLLLPALRGRRGRIIWIGSLAGRQSLAFQAHYSATKAGVAAVSDALRVELQPLGVQVSCVEPGDIATGFTDARRHARGEGSPYAAQAARWRVAVERGERGAPAPAGVARIVERLVARRQMPSRVPAGRLGRTTCLFLRLVPHSIGQWAASLMYGV